MCTNATTATTATTTSAPAGAISTTSSGAQTRFCATPTPHLTLHATFDGNDKVFDSSPKWLTWTRLGWWFLCIITLPFCVAGALFIAFIYAVFKVIEQLGIVGWMIIFGSGGAP